MLQRALKCQILHNLLIQIKEILRAVKPVWVHFIDINLHLIASILSSNCVHVSTRWTSPPVVRGLDPEVNALRSQRTALVCLGWRTDITYSFLLKWKFPCEPLTDVCVNAIKTVLKAVLGVGGNENPCHLEIVETAFKKWLTEKWRKFWYF